MPSKLQIKCYTSFCYNNTTNTERITIFNFRLPELRAAVVGAPGGRGGGQGRAGDPEVRGRRGATARGQVGQGRGRGEDGTRRPGLAPRSPAQRRPVLPEGGTEQGRGRPRHLLVRGLQRGRRGRVQESPAGYCE